MAPRPRRRHAGVPLLLALCGIAALSACAAKYAQVPARVDLEPYGRVALLTFSAERADTGMTAMATQRFAEALLESQGIELLELGSQDSSLQALAARDVPAVFFGHLKLSEVKPKGRVSTSGIDVRGAVTAELTVRLVSTKTGGTVWRSSAAANRTLGHLGLHGGGASVGMRNRDEAYGEIVGALVANVTRDLRPTWVKQ
jgi:hypothetical protein